MISFKKLKSIRKAYQPYERLLAMMYELETLRADSVKIDFDETSQAVHYWQAEQALYFFKSQLDTAIAKGREVITIAEKIVREER